MATQAPSATIDQLIISSPYDEPAEHWKYDRETRRFTREPGRRPAGYVRASDASKSFDDPGEFVELPLVNKIRPRVDAWRSADYPGASGITRRLLKHWRDTEQREGSRRFFFCQLEAIETLMWLAEAPESDRVGIKIPGDGGEFTRLCSKMATGSGKTILMSMLIAWQVLNKVTYPQDKRFSKNILVIAPGLTVRNRLEVLVPGSAGNYYQEFQIIPPGLEDKLRQGQTCRVQVRNWHKLDWDSEEQISKRRSVDKRGALSDEAYVREVLGEMHSAENLLVINDEAHHAWRVPPKVKIAGLSKDELKEATKWVGGLDRIHRARGILMCYDLTATPFAPTGRKSGEETLFGWIVRRTIECNRVRSLLCPHVKTDIASLICIQAHVTIFDFVVAKNTSSMRKRLYNYERLSAGSGGASASCCSVLMARKSPVLAASCNGAKHKGGSCVCDPHHITFVSRYPTLQFDCAGRIWPLPFGNPSQF